MRVLILSQFHHKNQEGLLLILQHLQWEFKFGKPVEIPQFNIIISPIYSVDTSLYPKQFFIFGPHFSVYPNQLLNNIHNVHNNCIYLQPSDWAREFWKGMGVEQFVPLKTFSFPVNTNKFHPISNSNRNKVFIYFKRRKAQELDYLCTFLKNKGIEYSLFDYIQRYREEDYLSFVQQSKYGIILDAHESQGFAIEEALSCNVPLLVWSVTSLNQEEGGNYPDIKATTIPYWDERCGEYFTKQEEFEMTFELFLQKIETYQPREYIMEHLSLNVRAKAFQKLIQK